MYQVYFESIETSDAVANSDNEAGRF